MYEILTTVLLVNCIYASVGASMTIIFSLIMFKLFDWIVPSDIETELDKGNISVGIVVGSIFLSIGISVGLVVSAALN